jgi:hypothetical protein
MRFYFLVACCNLLEPHHTHEHDIATSKLVFMPVVAGNASGDRWRSSDSEHVRGEVQTSTVALADASFSIGCYR